MGGDTRAPGCLQIVAVWLHISDSASCVPGHLAYSDGWRWSLFSEKWGPRRKEWAGGGGVLQEQRLGELWKSRKGLPAKTVPKQSLEVGLEANSQREGGRLFQVGKYMCRGRSGSCKACGRAKGSRPEPASVRWTVCDPFDWDSCAQPPLGEYRSKYRQYFQKGRTLIKH